MPRTLSLLVAVASNIWHTAMGLICLLEQGQGAGQAIEDAAHGKETYPREVPEPAAQLYEKIRCERAHNTQEFSRQAGQDWVNGKPTIESSRLRFLFSSTLTYMPKADKTIISDRSHELQLWPQRNR